MLENLSTEEIFKLVKEHDDRQGYQLLKEETFQDFLNSRNENYHSAKDEFVRPGLIEAYESRTDVWEDYKKILNVFLKMNLKCST